MPALWLKRTGASTLCSFWLTAPPTALTEPYDWSRRTAAIVQAASPASAPSVRMNHPDRPRASADEVLRACGPLNTFQRKAPTAALVPRPRGARQRQTTARPLLPRGTNRRPAVRRPLAKRGSPRKGTVSNPLCNPTITTPLTPTSIHDSWFVLFVALPCKKTTTSTHRRKKQLLYCSIVQYSTHPP